LLKENILAAEVIFQNRGLAPAPQQVQPVPQHQEHPKAPEQHSLPSGTSRDIPMLRSFIPTSSGSGTIQGGTILTIISTIRGSTDRSPEDLAGDHVWRLRAGDRARVSSSADFISVLRHQG
jgi:hypothetical protein